MSLTHDQLHHFAHALMDASEAHTPISPLTDELPELTPEGAYEIAADIIGHKMGNGRHIVGRKVGVTSEAAQKALGIDTPSFGIILDDMTVRDGGRVRMSNLIQPKVEAEIGFRLKDVLKGPGVTADDVIAATEYVFPALEIVDSRIIDWKVKRGDLIADNTASAMVVLGNTHIAPGDIDLPAEQVSLTIDGMEIASGEGSAVLGHPANAIAWLANTLSEMDMGIGAGEFVIPGSMIAPQVVRAGNAITAAYGSLGIVSVSFI
jgi:2-oxopent-4-enoate hydratase